MVNIFTHLITLSPLISLSLKSGASASTTVDTVKRGVVPFLRCAALFFHCLTGVPAPEELSSTTGETQSHSTI